MRNATRRSSRRTNWDRMEEVDATRTNPDEPEATQIEAALDCPRTAGNFVYPETCVVDAVPGRWPAWFQPFVSWIRRIQTRKDPDYGFVTENWSCFAVTSYVANEPGNGRYLFRGLREAAVKAGWVAVDLEPGRRYVLTPPRQAPETR